MEFDELKRLWQQTDERIARLESAVLFEQRRTRRAVFDRIRTKLRIVHVVLWYEIAFGAMIAILVGRYLADLPPLRFSVPAFALWAGATVTVILAVRQLAAILQLDFGEPVVHLQRRLAKLRLIRARANRWLLISCPLLWALLIIVIPHGLIGLDLYHAFGVAWVLGNLGVGVLCLAMVGWAVRRFPAWARKSTLLAWLGDDFTGRRVAAVSGQLEEIAAFDSEER